MTPYEREEAQAIAASPIGKLCYVCKVRGEATPATHEGYTHLISDLVPYDAARYGLCDQCRDAVEGSN